MTILFWLNKDFILFLYLIFKDYSIFYIDINTIYLLIVVIVVMFFSTKQYNNMLCCVQLIKFI